MAEEVGTASDRLGECRTTGTGIGDGVYVGRVVSIFGEGTRNRTTSWLQGGRKERSTGIKCSVRREGAVWFAQKKSQSAN
jgi:hypothetical protein